ncbi:hypothetical protein SAMN05421788_10236 [Filimonas lacunae]|uniref:DUF6265 domain-containing protein n=1 Tax=Filimonas lacunae TaxID=477680 RepID=A0A173MI86_9BACT|nr:DUF6265 family protein [Filimonas lacunae]BAV07342.1 hypothetical protein FLA_3365 [Filimonas lacunae]SIS91065.1 hypothetical protein SAMN05421788_10236 [Filimonas lacunae]
MKRIITLLAFTCLGFIIPMPSSKLQQARWILGVWQQKAGKRTQIEEWKQADDSTFTGRSYFLKGKDTVLLEQTTLEYRHQQLFYVPVVQGQNNEQPVRFTLTDIQIGKLVFENKEHDFPQKITYQRITQDSAVAEIAGMLKGSYQARPFPMKRIQ